MNSELSIFQPEIFNKFRNGTTLLNGTIVDGSDFFIASISLIAQSVAQNMFSCNIEMNEDNLATARLYWVRDMDRIEIRQNEHAPSHESSIPNEFKQAGFLAYWLRRRMVVTKSKIINKTTIEKNTRFQNEFANSSSETIAFMIGLYLCIYYHLRPSNQSTVSFDKVLKDAIPSFEYIMDAVNLMKNKNVSPQALYLIYKSLFMHNPADGIK